MDAFTNFVRPELLVLIPVLVFVGIALKKSTGVKDKMIPLCLLGIGIVLATIWVLATSALDSPQNILLAVFTAIVQGALCAGGAVFFDQAAFKQPKKEE
jgi:chromate transport protein ChrA